MRKFLCAIAILLCITSLVTTLPVNLIMQSAAYAETENTPEPTKEATPEPAAAPTAAPTAVPTEAPTATPTAVPTEAPTATPTVVPTEAPTATPTVVPAETTTAVPTEAPTAAPTEVPTEAPSVSPSATATEGPSESPSEAPSATPETSASASPLPEESIAAEVTPDPASIIDYSLSAAKNPAFISGFALLLENAVPVYPENSASAVEFANISSGIVYAISRNTSGVDRLNIAFNADPEAETQTGWVDAEYLRPLDPETEVKDYIASCENDDDVVCFKNDAAIPLKPVIFEYAVFMLKAAVVSVEPEEIIASCTEYELIETQTVDLNTLVSIPEGT
ncbi:MAG: hypothetical protein IJA26_05720, partial [Clostridia bacterium]|nr:hypothetical protein [Clostridia bacterium]